MPRLPARLAVTDLPTPVNVPRLKQLLYGYDPAKTQYLIDGLSKGFIIPVSSDIKAVQSPNHPSAAQHASAISTDISIELSKGRVAGPFDSPPLPNFFVSPIGMIPKKTPGQFRRIHDLSCPHDASVNDRIPKDMCSVQYETLDHVTKFVVQYGPGSFIAKTDFENAFRMIPLSPQSYHLMGFRWRNKYYYDKCLPMGCSLSCKIFEEFSSAIQWILLNHFKMEGVSHILDDFIFVNDSYRTCNRNLECFLALARWLNVPVKAEKTFPPANIQTVHGIEVDTTRMLARLPLDKLTSAKEQLSRLRASRKTTLRALQVIIGVLNFACRVVLPGRAFLRRLIALTRGLTRPFHHVRLNGEAKNDMDAWLMFLDQYNGCTLLREEIWITSNKLHLYTDSAGSVGYAAVLGKKWFRGEWPYHWKTLSIAFLELFPIITAVQLWAKHFNNKCILFHTDNIAIVSIINSQSSKDPAIMCLVRKLVVTSLIHNIMFKAVHIPGAINYVADFLSRAQVSKAMEKDPELDTHPVRVPESLQPESLHLHTSWLLRSPKLLKQPTD